jgi:hypothetical protein
MRKFTVVVILLICAWAIWLASLKLYMYEGVLTASLPAGSSL